MNPISFKAKLVTLVDTKQSKGATSVPKNAALIEFSPESPRDLKALNALKSRFWEYDRLDWDTFGNDKRHVYGLTTQVDSFENPAPQKVFGTVSVYEDLKTKEGFIDSIKVKKASKSRFGMPKFVEVLQKVNIFSFNSKKEENVAYNGVKTVIIDTLKSVYDKMSVVSSSKSIDFFKKNGFVALIPKDKKFLTWRR